MQTEASSWEPCPVGGAKGSLFRVESYTLRVHYMWLAFMNSGHYTTNNYRPQDKGFNVDVNLTMTSQVANVCRIAYYHLSRIAKIRDSISTTVCKSLIHGLVTSRLDYGNAILYGISDRHMHRLEMVQRSAARIVKQIRRYTGCLSESESILNYLYLCTGPYTMARRSILRHCYAATHLPVRCALQSGYC